MRSCLALTIAIYFLSILPCQGKEPFFLKDGQRVLFVGDSNTFAGQYIAYLDTFLVTRFPDKKFELINVGLPSETVSGLSEPDHPFPRPDLHTRLPRVLHRTKPDVVVACYGMNDAIYYPFSRKRFEKHQQGIRKLIREVRQAGAKIVLVTTPPFDPVPVKKRLLPAGADKYSWMKPYEKYDEVLRTYAKWLVSLRKEGFLVVDAHSAIEKHLKEMRMKDPGYRLAGDGIHPNPMGHWLIAAEILQAWNAPAVVSGGNVFLNLLMEKRDSEGRASVSKMKEGLQLKVRTKLPFPTDSRWPESFPEKEAIEKDLNRFGIQLIYKGKRFHVYPKENPEKKFVLNNEVYLDFHSFPNLGGKRSRQVLDLVEKRQRILGRAWLTDIGHNRPNTPKGIPLAKAKEEAAKLDAEIRSLTRPVDFIFLLKEAKKK